MISSDLADHLYDHHSSDDGLYRYWIEDYPLASLFRYRGTIRKLILDYKIKGRYQSGLALVDIFVADGCVRGWAQEASHIMAVPSSFWGRWRGKHDLASTLAERLSQAVGVPILKAPRSRFFRFKKQSFQTLDERIAGELSRPRLQEDYGIFGLRKPQIHATKGSESERPLILLVDDIVTSAATLKGLADAMPFARYRFLTLATAYKARLREDRL